MRTNTQLFAALLTTVLLAPAHAEITGSGTPHGSCPGAIGDRIWHDIDANGIQDAGEPGLAGIAVHVRSGAAPYAVDVMAISDAKGRYLVGNLCDELYIVTVDATTLPPGLVPTALNGESGLDAALDNDAADMSAGTTVDLSGAAEADMTVDFGFTRSGCGAEIRGRLWDDEDRNGGQDSYESGLANVGVHLYDAQGALIGNTVSGANGTYRFGTLCNATYLVDIDDNDPRLTGLVPTLYRAVLQSHADSDQPADGSAAIVQLQPAFATTTVAVDFGFYRTDCGGKIGATVFHDADGSGARAGVERGLGGVDLRLLDSDATVLQQTSSDSDGSYAFTGLCAGDYGVDASTPALPPSFRPTGAALDGPVAVTLATDSTVIETIEIGFASSCTGSIGDLVWLDVDGDGQQGPEETGLEDVEITLRDAAGRERGVAKSAAGGGYGFAGLCAGDYAVQVAANTLPNGMRITAAGAGVASRGPEPVWVSLLTDGATVTDIDFGVSPLASCELGLELGCALIAPPRQSYSCVKPIEALSLIWDGAGPVRVVAHKGNEGDEVLLDVDNVMPGDLLTVTGMTGSPSDVVWEIFAPGTATKLGESKFHVSCSDAEMNGPAHCGTRQGDGKDNKTEYINDWLLEGIVDASGELDCTLDLNIGADTCSFEAFPASCENLNEVHAMTFSVTGGGCSSSTNDQEGKFQCNGEVDASAPVVATLEDGSTVTVAPGQPLTVPKDGSDTDIVLDGASGTQVLRLHTSCSKSLAVGDVFGGLTLHEINGRGDATNMLLTYAIVNTGRVDVGGLDLPEEITGSGIEEITGSGIEEITGSGIATFSLHPAAGLTLAARVYATASEPRGATVSGEDISGSVCSATDFVDLQILPPPPCIVDSSLPLHIHNDHLKWELTNAGPFTAMIDGIHISWPVDNGALEEVKFDGTKIFATQVAPESLNLGSSDWIDDPAKRELPAGETHTLEFKFDGSVVGPQARYDIRVDFAEGCSIELQ